jgi:hypothetical protein
MPWCDPKDDKCLDLVELEKIKIGSRQRYMLGAILILDSRHYRECESFRIDSRTIKRGILQFHLLTFCHKVGLHFAYTGGGE